EGKFHSSWSQSSLGGTNGARQIEAGMNKMFGTNIKITFSPGRSMAGMSAKIRAEAAAGTPATSDIYLGSSPFALPLIKRKILIAYPWTKLLPGRITAAMVEARGAVIRVATGLSGVTYNTKLAPGGKAPTSLSDFLGPAWKGKIASTPYAASFDTLSANGVWGKEKTVNYVKKLAKNIRGLIRCGEGERIATGEIIALVMDCSGQTAEEWAAKGAPIAQFLSPEAAIKRHFYLGVPTNSSNKFAAALYAVFLLTPEGQKIVWKNWHLDSDLFPESNIGKQVRGMEKKGAKFAEATIAFQKAHPEINKIKKTIVKILKSAK
ncbi:extracellular solute-binding protein, partial [Alphaproteobacteria bacterium]|nr:extracellular solute-binding protein [Alphaproteobacteria bacterium]